MKKLFTLLLSSFLFASAIAQTVTITFNGTNKLRNYQVILDDESYYSNSRRDPKAKPIQVKLLIDDLELGAHQIQVFRLKTPGNYSNGSSNNSTNGRVLYSREFQLREGYDMNIAIMPNGSVSFMEKRIKNNNNNNNNNNQTRTAVSDETYNQLEQSVRSKWLQSQKLTTETEIFRNANYYFTTSQVRQLLLLLDSETNRLALAKMAYSKVVDPTYFTDLYDVFNTTASRDAMNVYIRNNPNNNNSNNNNNTNNNNNQSKSAMADYQFNQLLQSINGQWSQGDKMISVRNAFSTSADYYSTSQIRQLLSVISSQADRLTLAKLAWPRVSDAVNFNSLYNLFYSQADRDDLNNFITGNTNNNSQYKTAMADYQFNQLLQSINNEYNQGDKIAAINNSLRTNYFTAAQLRSLLTGINYEADKLALAKAGYLRLTDVSNFGLVYDLFATQSYRDDLNNYVRANGGTTFNTNTKVAMSDAAFIAVLQKVRNHFLPWDKVRDAREAFNNNSNYFSTYQIRQILLVISGENDRLEMAKLSYKTVTDPANFLQLADIFTTQVSKDDFINYVNSR